LGAVAVKQAAYVLPDSPPAREDFEWLKGEIEAAGGEASVFAADSVDGRSDDEIIEAFRRSREESYGKLGQEIERALRRRRVAAPRGVRPPPRRRVEEFERRLADIEAVDFFGSDGRDRVVSLLNRLKIEVAGGPVAVKESDAGARREEYRGRLWVTRPRPGIDRIASAWLIRRFIDSDARFAFADDPASVPRDGVPFDMFGVELSHLGDRCTFETLQKKFGVEDTVVERLAAIVHDLDLKDARFDAPETPAVGALIDGLQKLYADDDSLLAQGGIVFEALYRGLQQAARPTGPRHRAARGLASGDEVGGSKASWRFCGYFLRLGATGFETDSVVGSCSATSSRHAGGSPSRTTRKGSRSRSSRRGRSRATRDLHLGFAAASSALARRLPSSPSFLMVWGISAAYVRFGGLPDAGPLRHRGFGHRHHRPLGLQAHAVDARRLGAGAIFVIMALDRLTERESSGCFFRGRAHHAARP
jgi:hypothetical protein